MAKQAVRLEYNVKAFGATGDGATDDRTAVLAAITAAGANGGDVYFPKGTYRLGASLTGASGVRFRGAGKTVSIIKAGDAHADTTLLVLSGKVDVTIEGLGFDGNNRPGMTWGVYVTGNGTKKNFRLRDCSFVDFAGIAVYVWTSEAVWIERNEFTHCAISINTDQPQNDVYIRDNRIVNTVAAYATEGILMGSGSIVTSDLVCSGNYIEGINLDSSGTGARAWAILLSKVRGAIISDNHVKGCGAATGGGGILVGAQSQGATVRGNVVHDSPSGGTVGSGLYLEMNSPDTSLGADGSPRGAIVCANSFWNLGSGILCSYAAGSIITDNLIHDMTGDGIVSDSEAVVIEGNVVYNCWKTAAGGTGGKSGIRYYGAGKGLIRGNRCFDNQAVKTQEYGIGVGAAAITVEGNDVQGNKIGGVFLSFTTPTHIVRDNVGYNPVGVQANPFHDGNSTIGLGGAGPNPASTKVYTARFTDLVIDSQGGAGVTITIYDSAGTQIRTGLTELVGYFLPVNHQIKWVHAGAPTVIVSAV